MINSNSNLKVNTTDIVLVALSVALITICSWISIPLVVPITLQTFAVFAITGLLGLKRGTLAVFVHNLLGAIGLPVFAGVKGGIGVLLGNTGGYRLGFLLSAIIIGVITKFFGKKILVLIISMVLGLLVCYVFGTAWFMYIYTQSKGPVELTVVLSWCVFPFVLPDVVKIVVAAIVVNRVSKHIRY